MKQVLNASGSAFVQATELAKSPAELAGSMLLLETNFDQWMDERFVLSSSQQAQIANMNDSFKAILAESIAQELSAGRSIGFSKDLTKSTTLKGDELRDKDVIIFRTQQQSYNFDSGEINEGQGLQILIQYS